MIKITDKSFHYTPSFNTDLRKKFRKMEQDRRLKEKIEAARAEQAEWAAEQAAKSNVQPLKKTAK